MIKGYKNLNEYLDLIGKLSSINQRKLASNNFNPCLYVHRIKRQEHNWHIDKETMIKISVLNGDYLDSYHSADTNDKAGTVYYVKDLPRTNIVDTIWATNITKEGKVKTLVNDYIEGRDPICRIEVKKLVRENIPYVADLYFDIPEEKKQDIEGGGPDPFFFETYLYGVFYLEFVSHYANLQGGRVGPRYQHVGVSEFFQKECIQYAKYSKFEMLNMIKKAQGLEQLPSKPKPTLKIK